MSIITKALDKTLNILNDDAKELGIDINEFEKLTSEEKLKMTCEYRRYYKGFDEDNLNYEKILNYFRLKLTKSKKYKIKEEVFYKKNSVSLLECFIFIFSVTFFMLFLPRDRDLDVFIVSICFFKAFILGFIMTIPFEMLGNHVYKKNKNKFNVDIEYLMPLSSKELNKFMQEYKRVKKHVLENKDVIYSQYTIDTILDVNKRERSIVDKLELTFDCVYQYRDDLISYKIKQFILKKQHKNWRQYEY